MKITAIKAQIRQQGRFSIFLEGKYAFSLSDQALLDSKIVPGQELTAPEVERLKQLSADDKLLGAALRYAMLRPRSNWEMETYLRRKNVTPLLLQKILSKLSDLRLLDDAAFAKAWIDSRRLLKPVSHRRLVAELRAKRIPEEIAKQALEGDDTDERAVLKELVARKRKQTKYQDNTKLMQYLARQGFNYDDIRSVL